MPSNPVQEYYDKKKERYLKDAAGAARGMTTGTPFDWEDSERYLKDLPERDSEQKAKPPSRLARLRARLRRLLGREGRKGSGGFSRP